MAQCESVTQPNRLDLIRRCLEVSRQVEVRTILLERMRARIEELRFARSEQLSELARQVRASISESARRTQRTLDAPEAQRTQAAETD